LWTAHEVFPHDESGFLTSLLTKWFLFKVADRIIVHCHNTEEVLRRYFGREKSIIYIEHPDYDIDFYTKSDAKSILNENRFMFLCFGNMKPYKGFQQAVNAFPGDSIDKSLWIVGEMPSSNPASLSINKNGVVLHTGPATKRELELIVGAADVCILPYKWCTASGALTYLKQYGKPIIISNARCLQMEGYPYGILRFGTTSDLRNAMISSINIAHENNLTLERNINNPIYKAKASSIYNF